MAAIQATGDGADGELSKARVSGRQRKARSPRIYASACSAGSEDNMSLTTNYLGLPLKNPIVVSSSPLSHSVDSIRRLKMPALLRW